ncbi:MAG: hypothetical protein LBU10_00630 [Endomicrobium sp.]|jgi:hypothetical protein|nr:hypothetical protein [Endomicrobium sp.]
MKVYGRWRYSAQQKLPDNEAGNTNQVQAGQEGYVQVAPHEQPQMGQGLQQGHIESLNYNFNMPAHYKYFKEHNLTHEKCEIEKRHELVKTVSEIKKRLNDMSSKLSNPLKGILSLISEFIWRSNIRNNIYKYSNILIGKINELNQMTSDMESGYEENLKKVEEEYNALIDSLKEKMRLLEE